MTNTNSVTAAQPPAFLGPMDIQSMRTNARNNHNGMTNGRRPKGGSASAGRMR